MTWLMIIGGLWILGKVLESMESSSAQSYTLAGSNQRISGQAMGYIEKYLAEIDAICVRNRVGYALGFIQTCVALQMAKADGVITKDELKTIKASIMGAYGSLISENDLQKAQNLNKEHLGKLSRSEISALAGALVVHLGNIVMENFDNEDARNQLVVLILTLPYEVALADGQVTDEEEALFNAICDAAEISPDIRAYIIRIAEFNVQQKSDFEKHIDDKIRKVQEALQLFGLKQDFTNEDLKDTWRTYAKLNHPDRFHNVDPIMHSQIKERFQKGASARDLIEENLAEIRKNPQVYFDKSEATTKREQYTPPSPESKTSHSKQEYRNSEANSENVRNPEPVSKPQKQLIAWAEIFTKVKFFFLARFNAIRRLDGKYILSFIRNHMLKFSIGIAALLVIIGSILAYPEIRFHRNLGKLLTREVTIHDEGAIFFMDTNDYNDRLKNILKAESDSIKDLLILEVLQSKQVTIDDDIWAIVKERFENYIEKSGTGEIPISLRMLASLPLLSVKSSEWLFDLIVRGDLADERNAIAIMTGKKIVGPSLTPLFSRINSCLQQCRVPKQAIAAIILQSKVDELKPEDLKSAISALQKSLIGKKQYLEVISTFFGNGTALDAYRSFDAAFVVRLVTQDTHSVDECSAQLSLALSNPLFGKEFMVKHRAHIQKNHPEAFEALSPQREVATHSENRNETVTSYQVNRSGVIKSSECVQLRSKASIYSPSYGCFAPGTPLVVIRTSEIQETHHGETANWIKVKLGNRVGWMFGAFVQEQ